MFCTIFNRTSASAFGLNDFIRLFFVTLICIAPFGCTKSSGDGDDGDSESSSGSGGGGVTNVAGEANLDCGVVMNGALQNPVAFADGIEVRVTNVVSDNLVVVEETGALSNGPRLVRLHGIASQQGFRKDAAMGQLRRLTAGQFYFYQASPDCSVAVEGGGQGTVGQLITRTGKSLSEELAKIGAEINSNDACGGDFVSGCLNALTEQAPQSAGTVQDFLWKPLSDTKGDLAVVLEEHCNAVLLVNGEEFKPSGASNGRCGTYVGRRPGCAYGSNIKVEVIDKVTGKPYMHQGQPYVTVPNGCSRFEFL